jgi:hypothetical protein
MIMQRINLGGSPWCPADTRIAPPKIYGLLAKPADQCTGLVVGVSARQVAPSRNAWHVEREADTVEIARRPGELLYALDKPSLVLRAAEQVGTARGWALQYEGDAT